MSNYKAITGSSKIVHRNQGGGSKLQGIPSSTNLNTAAHVAFRNRNVVCPCNRNVIFCMNQLGGIGRGRSQFGVTADGINCTDKEDHLEKFRRYLVEINHYIQTVLLPAAINSEGVSNEFSNYELCLVGNRESLISDIYRNNSEAYNTISNKGFGSRNDNVIFTHLLTTPHPTWADDVPNPLSITYWDSHTNDWNTTTLNFGLLQIIQDKINFCNNYLRIIRPNLFIPGQYPMNTLGTHTLGFINNNVHFNGTSATSFLQNLYPMAYGNSQLFYSDSPLTNNPINIFTGEDQLFFIQISALEVNVSLNGIIQIILNENAITKLRIKLNVTTPSQLSSFKMRFSRKETKYYDKNYPEYSVNEAYTISSAYYLNSIGLSTEKIDSFILSDNPLWGGNTVNIYIEPTNPQNDIDQLKPFSNNNVESNKIPPVVITFSGLL